MNLNFENIVWVAWTSALSRINERTASSEGKCNSDICTQIFVRLWFGSLGPLLCL